MLSLILGAGFAAACSSAPALGPSAPNYLGAQNLTEKPQPETATRVSAGKVLSAIVFERVTGLAVDPARLVER